MGNCLRSLNQDDISLLRTSEDLQQNEPTSTYPSSPYIGNIPRPVYHPNPNVSLPASQLTEEEQIKIAKRIGLIHHLPCGTYDGSKKTRECVICMGDFTIGDRMRYLPCVHMYHKRCIDDWLMRSFTCPSCMEPVDSALLMTYQTN